ncbi:hypothetical protein C0991_011897 [Blastosporella zonata]|nr:hypothetical protein C0991_011897 [Blastosporella zonata]
MGAKEPTYAPTGVSASDLQAERLCFFGSLLATLAYGALLMLYIQLAGVLIVRPKRGVTFWAVVAYASFMFPLATLAIGTIFKFSEESYIDNRNFPGGPHGFYIRYSSDYVNVLAVSIPLMIAVALSETPAWSPYISMSYHALNVAFNTYTTFTICLRLRMLRPRLEAVAGKLHASFYTSVITTFVESGGFFTAWVIAYLIARSQGNVVQNLFYFPVPFIQRLGYINSPWGIGLAGLVDAQYSAP